MSLLLRFSALPVLAAAGVCAALLPSVTAFGVLGASAALAIYLLRDRLDRIDVFSPWIIVPVPYIVYFGIGSLNLLDFSSAPASTRAFVGPQIWAFVLLGLAGYAAGLLSSKVVGTGRRDPGRSGETPRARLPALAFAAAGLAVMAVIVKLHGIPLSSGGRAHVSGYLTYLSGAFLAGIIVLLFLYIQSNEKSSKIAAVLVASMVVLSLSGYRTYVLILALTTLIAYNYRRRRLGPGLVAAAFAAMAIASVAFFYMRAERYEGEHFLEKKLSAVGIQPWHGRFGKFISLLYISYFREGTSNFNALLKIVPENSPHTMGGVFLSSFATAIPGKQLSAREHVTWLIAHDTHTSLTPSVLGVPYLDFGAAGIFGWMFIMGFILGALHDRTVRGEGGASPLLYAYFATISVLGIHTGLTDPLILLVLPVMIWMIMELSSVFTRSIPACK